MNVYEEITSFYQSYRGEKCIYGQSALGRNLYALHIGSREGPQIISQYAIHAREWVTSLVALYHIRRGLACGGAWILPLTNPDGALLAETGIISVPEARRGTLLAVHPSGEFALWKANANAVDLNVNFDARWGTGASNLRNPSAANYIGEYPVSEPETKALVQFTQDVRPCATVSWHTKGEEIYWEFHQRICARHRDKKLAAALSASTGYPLVTVKNSAGGYKDWCIETLKIPAFTVEVGSDALKHPLTRAALPEILNRTLDALVDLNNAISRFSP